MHNAIENMLKQYQCKTVDDYKNALKEIIQEIALLGLYRAYSKSSFLTTAAVNDAEHH